MPYPQTDDTALQQFLENLNQAKHSSNVFSCILSDNR